MLTVTGSGFGSDPNFVEANFNDGTACEILTASESEVTCRVVEMSSTDGVER